MRHGPTACLAVASALAIVAGCGGGGGGNSTTTSAATVELSTTLPEPTTTSTTIDPALRELLLVAADLPAFKEAAPAPGPGPDERSSCDQATAPAYNAVQDDPSVKGATFERGSGAAGPVEVSSEVTSSSPDEAEAALDELLKPALADCLEADLLKAVQTDAAAGTTPTVKLTATEATLSGVDQVVLLSSTITVEGGAATSTARSDLVLLRSGGTVVGVSYGGPSALATTAERQRIVAIAAKKLAGANAGTGTGSTTSSTDASRGSTTSSRRTSSTRRATSTTRRSTSTTTGSTSTTA